MLASNELKPGTHTHTEKRKIGTNVLLHSGADPPCTGGAAPGF
jgi:hypothetical protein